jgi:hypothetical protein
VLFSQYSDQHSSQLVSSGGSEYVDYANANLLVRTVLFLRYIAARLGGGGAQLLEWIHSALDAIE